MRSDEELIRWFRERLVWNDPATVTDLLKNGLFVRLYEPQARPSAHHVVLDICAQAAPRHLWGQSRSWLTGSMSWAGADTRLHGGR